MSDFMDVALGCVPFRAPDLADNGALKSAQGLNELAASQNQLPPVALVPAGDPMVLDGNGNLNLVKLNAYRAGVFQPPAASLDAASTAVYCLNMLTIAPPSFIARKQFFINAPSPVAGKHAFGLL